MSLDPSSPTKTPTQTPTMPARNFLNVDLSILNFNQGIKISGAAASDYTGCSVSNAGDINGDGYDDIIIGAYQADPNSRASAGISYVIFGVSSGLADIDLSSLTSAQGFKIFGAKTNDQSGWSVSGAGDVNGDGYSDFIIGAPNANSYTGTTYIIFGKSSGFLNIDLLSITSAQGFKVFGVTGNHAGSSVSSAGDINGDGYDDIIIGASQADLSSRTDAGTSYVIFGKSSGFVNINLSYLTSAQGFKIFGAATNDYAGFSVSNAGDVNGDGYDALLLEHIKLIQILEHLVVLHT